MRQFETGATRNTDTNELDYEAFLSPAVLRCYAAYMAKHAKQKNGELRPGDNWQRGMPKNAYMKSGLRHVFDWWLEHRGETSRDGLKDALCAVIFNASGYLFELLKDEKGGKTFKGEEAIVTLHGITKVPSPTIGLNSEFPFGCPECDTTGQYATHDAYVNHFLCAHPALIDHP